jgi:nucleotide-binding universal stress UspA family protein
MVEDIVANLSVGSSRDVATDFAVSVPGTFDAHLTGVAFLYEPLVAQTDRYGFPAAVIQSQRIENEKAAKAAATKFDEVVRRAAVSAGSRMLDVAVGESAKSDEMPGADIAHHLARHGAKVEVKSIVTAETDVASTMLSHAADTSADFLVMGGSGHSRLREFILGGATRGILSSMTLPTLMSH